jgi:hypothetical protein
MRTAAVHPFLALMAIIAAAACADRAPGADSVRDSVATPAPSDSAGAAGSTPTSAGAQPNTRASQAAPPAGRPACAKPVTVTYYARGGVPDEFIVTFGGKNGANADALTDSLARRHGFTPTHRYDGAFSGFSAKLPLGTLEAIRCEPAVTRISQVVVGSIGAVPPT